MHAGGRQPLPPNPTHPEPLIPLCVIAGTTGMELMQHYTVGGMPHAATHPGPTPQCHPGFPAASSPADCPCPNTLYQGDGGGSGRGWKRRPCHACLHRQESGDAAVWTDMHLPASVCLGREDWSDSGRVPAGSLDSWGCACAYQHRRATAKHCLVCDLL